MSWSILSDETAKQKREKKRKRRIKRGSKRGRYVVLGSRARNGRKAAIHCVTCGDTIRSNVDGLVCSVCAKDTESKVNRNEKKKLEYLKNYGGGQMSIPQMSHQITPQSKDGQIVDKKTTMQIPGMSGEK